jgi:hypothetical protein
LGSAIIADVTVSLIAMKLGFVDRDGPDTCGEAVVAPIGIPSAAFAELE